MVNILTENDVQDSENADKFILKQIKNSIPDTLDSHLSNHENRKKMFEKYGERSFLSPNELKYPVINPFTEEYDCRLIYAAQLRAQQHGNDEIEEKAKKLYDEQGCETEIDIELQDGTQLHLHEIFDLFLIEGNEYQEFFKSKLNAYGVSSPSQLSDDDKTKFFKEIKKEWKSKK